MSVSNDWLIIGISGVTCGGKTTLANKLKNILTPSYIFNQDKYFYPDNSDHHIKCEGLDHNNYDILSALDMGTMYDDILKTMEGNNKAHESNTERKRGAIEIKGKSFMIVEGFTVLNYKPINDICNLRYYFVLEFGECASRRALRLYSPPDTPRYFEDCVWPEHLRHRRQIEGDTRVKFLNGTAPNSLDEVLYDLKSFGSTEVP